MTYAEGITLAHARATIDTMPDCPARSSLERVTQLAERVIAWRDNDPHGEIIDHFQLAAIMRAAIKASGMTQSAWADERGMVPKALSAVLNQHAGASDRTARLVGYRKVTRFQKDTKP